MSILAIGDPHFKLSNTERTDEMVEKILKVIDRECPSLLVIMGDTLHDHEKGHSNPLKRAIDFLHRVSSKVKTFLLIGNHDLCSNAEFLTDNHFFNACKYWGDRLTVVDKVIRWENYLFVPYVPPGRFREALGDENLTDIKYIFAHQQFSGAVDRGHTLDGDSIEGLPPIISGHIHVHQRKKNLLYVGSPIQHDVDDESRKTISLIGDTLDSEMRIDLGVKSVFNVSIDYSQLDTYVPPEGVIVRVTINGTNEENITAPSHKNVSKMLSQGHRVFYKTKIQKETKKPKTTHTSYSDLVKKKCKTPKLLDLYESIRN